MKNSPASKFSSPERNSRGGKSQPPESNFAIGLRREHKFFGGVQHSTLIADAEFLSGGHFEGAAVGKDEFEDERTVAGIFFHGGEDGFERGFVEALASES